MENNYKKPRVSIIIPVYNTEPMLLKKCLRSASAQDCGDFEVIVVDDGSRVETARFVDSFAKPGIKVLHKENGGLSDARNFGFKNCLGEYVYFLDSDDELASTKSMSLLLDCATSSRAEVVVGQFHFANCVDFDITASEGRDWLYRCLTDGRVSFSAADQLYSRELLNRMGALFVKGLVHEDEEFTPRALINARVVVGVSDIRTYIRNDIAGSITTSKNVRSVFSRCRGKLEVARLSMVERAFGCDVEIRRLIDERAYGFVAAALRSCARDLCGTEYYDQVIELANAIDYSRAAFTLRAPKAFRNWLCMRLVSTIGPAAFMRVLRAIDASHVAR